MAYLEVKPVYYKDNLGEDLRYRITFGDHVLALFTLEESANKFINSSLCEELVKHLSKKYGTHYEYTQEDIKSGAGTD